MIGPVEVALSVAPRMSNSGRVEWTPELSRAVVRWRAEGCSCREIGNKLGVSCAAVSRHLQRLRRDAAAAVAGGARRDQPPEVAVGADLARRLEGRSPAAALRLLCAAAFGVEEAALTGSSRAPEIAVVRMAACYVIRKRLGLSFARIGAVMGGRDHSTIVNAVQVTEGRMLRDLALAQQIAGLIGVTISLEPHDAHVRLLRALMAQRAAGSWRALEASLPPMPRPVDPAGELAEFLEQEDLLWCGQCDRSVREGERRACQSRFCSLRAIERLLLRARAARARETAR